MEGENFRDQNLEDGVWDEHALSRRGFLETIFYSVTGLTGVILGGVGVRLIIGDSFTAESQNWIELGSVTDFQAGQVHQFKYSKRVTDQWRQAEHAGILYIYSQDGANYDVIHGSCTHLGCNVNWREEENAFVCPCHHGRFDRQGNILGGPPPKPLRRLETKVEGGTLMALI